jgi:VCBS repeat-containing protein
MASRLTVFWEEAFSKHSRGKKRFGGVICALLGLTLASELGKAQSGASQPPVISTSTQWTLNPPVLASSSASGIPSNGFSFQGSFSPDGTHLLFWSRSSNLALGATSILSQLYLKDLTTGAVSVVSTDANGVEGNNDSLSPNNSSQILMFSPDGTKVVFESAATNLIATGTYGHQQIFIKDLTTGATSIVSVDGGGNQGNANSMNFTFSPDGTQVAFDSAATNLISGGTTGNQVFVKNLTTSAVTLVSADSTGVPGNGTSSYPVFSPDGTQIAFVSTSNNLAAAGTNPHSQIYVKNLQSGAVALASADASGNEANNDSLYPMFSPDGSKLAFNSISTNLVPNVPSFNSEVYVKDLATGTITLVSADANGVPANSNSSQLGSFSPDSTKIAFQSASINLVSGANGASQVYVKDLLTGTVTLVSASGAGAFGNGNSTMPTFSPNHLAVAFQSGAGNFGVTNFTSQIFVRPIFTASGAVADNAFSTSLSTAGQLAFSDSDITDTHTTSVAAQAGDLGTVTASVSKDSTGSGTGGVVRWNYQVDESQLHTLTAPATDNFTLTLTDSQGCIATTAIVVTALPQDFAITNTTSSTPASVSTSTSSCPTLTVTSSPSSVTVTSGQPASFSAAATGAPAPTVQWQVSSDGGATFTDLPGASSTTLTFTAAMSQNGNLYRAVFTNSTGSVTSSAATLIVNAAGVTTALVSSKNPTVFGQAVIFTATVSGTAGTPTGTVSFLDGASSLGSATLDSTGAASFTTSSLPVGNHSITASYSGDSNFNAGTSSTLMQIVNLDVPTVTVSVSPNPSVFGQPVVATATVSASAPGSGTPTGAVTFLDGLTNLGTANLDNGQASFTISALTAGLHSIMATYAGDGSFSQNSGTTGITVNKGSTATSLTSSPNPSNFNQAVTFAATLSAVAPGAGMPTGAITFSDGATSLGSATLDSTGTASFTTSTLGVGTHTIVTSYAGDSNFNASTSSLSQIVNKLAATVTLGSSTNPSIFGQSVTFAITVAAASGSGTPTGTVMLQDGDGTLSTLILANGQASHTTASLAVGSHSITATYNGDPNFGAASAALPQTINKDASSITLGSSANPSVFGQSVVMTATVSALAPGAGTPTGAITFSDGSTSLGTAALDSTGTASLTTSALGVGTHTITASYAGDSNFNASTSSLSQIVNNIAATVKLNSSANPSVFGQGVTFTITVAASGASTPTGAVTLQQDGSSTMTTLSLVNGQASFTTASLAIGSHSITASYGDGNFNSSSSTLAQMVNKASTATTLSSSASPSTLSQSVTFTAAVSVVAPGAGTLTGSVTFNDGSNALTTVPLNSNGMATLTTSSLAVNSHSITAVYSGDSNFNSSTGSMMQSVQYGICAQYDQTRSVRGGATFPIKIQICDANGNNLSSQFIVLHATAIIAASGVAGPVQDSGNANPDNDFRNVGGSGQNAGYIFNLSTDGLTTGTYALQFTVTGDPVLHTVFFGVQ